MKACGTVHKYGDNVDTDVIIPARYLNSSDPAELAKSCMEDIDPDFVNRVKKGDIMVANKNFGCGSSREHAPIAIKHPASAALLQRHLRAFFTVMPSISDSRSLSVRRQLRRSRREIRLRSILTAV